MAKNGQKVTARLMKLEQIAKREMAKTSGTMSKKDMLIEAGYTKSTAETRTGAIWDSPTFIARNSVALLEMQKVRDAAIIESGRRIKKAPLNHLTGAVDVMQKNIQLLSGKATENRAINIQISEAVADKSNPAHDPDATKPA